jgi:hypothetical protein
MFLRICLITEAVKKTNCTIIDSYDVYKVYLKVPQHKMTSITNKLMINIYAFSSTLTIKQLHAHIDHLENKIAEMNNQTT